MKKVKCIKEIPAKEYLCHSLSLGKTYEVISDSGYDYLLKDDLGKERYYGYKFFIACGIETEKIFKGSELQFRASDEIKWESFSDYFEIRFTPDYSKEIAELQRQIEILKNK